MSFSSVKGFERHAVLLKTVARVLHNIASVFDLDMLLSRSVNIICKEFELSDVCTFLIDESGEWAKLQACSSEAGRAMAAQGHQLRINQESIVGASIADCKVCIESNAGKESATLKNPGFPSVGSVMSLPLIAGDDVIGALILQSEEEAAFEDGDLIALQIMAEQLAIAIRNAILNRKTHELLSQAERRAHLLYAANKVGKEIASVLDLEALMPKMVDTIVEEYGFYYAGVFLLDQNSEWAALRAAYGEAGKAMLAEGHKLEVGGNSMIGACIRLNEARIALDVGKERVHFKNPYLPNTRSEMALPLSFGGKVLGAVTIQSIDERAFTDDDITTLQTMADHLAVAIQNAYTLNTLQEVSTELLRNKVYETLADVVTEAIHWIGNKALPISMTIQRIRDDLVDGNTDPALLQEDFDLIARSAEQIIHAKEQIIGPAREHKPRPVLLTDVIQAAAHQNGISPDKLQFDIDDAASHVTADSTQFARILGYLLNNAIEAGANKIMIQARLANEKGYAQIRIKDDGSGMPRDVRDKAWTPFFTTKNGHDGLGLPAALHVVSQLHGNIYLTSMPGKGTEIDISLPVAHFPLITPPKLENAPRSILLIDDDDDWSKFFIKQLGKNVTHRTSAQIDPQSDLILVDEHLEATSVEAVLNAAKNALVISKVVVITAAFDVDRMTRILRQGVRDVRLKPYSLEELSGLWM